MQGYDTVLPTQTVSSMCDCFTTPLIGIEVHSLPQAEHVNRTIIAPKRLLVRPQVRR